jgi:hypothetical protein
MAAQGAARRSLVCINNDSFPRASSSLNMQLRKKVDLHGLLIYCSNLPGTPTRHQVRHAHDLCMDSMVSKEVASELFDELPHWDDEEMLC